MIVIYMLQLKKILGCDFLINMEGADINIFEKVQRDLVGAQSSY
jgi:hypothetical protein